MKNAVEQIEDLIILTSHENEKYKNHLSTVFGQMFLSVLKKTQGLVKSQYNPNNTTLKAQKELQNNINSLVKSEMDKIETKLVEELELFTWASTKLTIDQLRAVFDPVKKYVQISKVKKSTVLNGFNNDYLTFNKGETHSVLGLYTIFLTSLQSHINQATLQAYTLEKSIDDYEDSLFGPTGSTNLSQNHLQSVITTLVAHGYNSALKYSFLENKKILDGYEWQSVLDAATTEICIDLDRRYWIYDRPEESTLPYEIVPPAHIGCRSATFPLVKTYEELGIDVDTLNDEQKELLGSHNIETKSYASFFNNQPESIKREILGPVRYSMYKNDNLTINKFFNRDGRKLSLAELQKKGYSISTEYLKYIRK